MSNDVTPMRTVSLDQLFTALGVKGKLNRITLHDMPTVTDWDAVSVDELAMLQEDINGLIKAVQRYAAILNAVLTNRFGTRAAQARLEKGKTTGTVRLDEDDYVVVCELPKKVEWDQEILPHVLNSLPGEIAEHLAKVSLEIEEKKFTALSPDLQKIISQARTVKTGKPTFKFERRDKEAA